MRTKEEKREYSKQYYLKNREYVDTKHKLKRSLFTEEDRKRYAQYTANFREKRKLENSIKYSPEELEQQKLEIVQKRKEKLKIRKDKDPEKWKIKMRASKLKADFNLTIEDYNKLLESQNGVCAICGKPETIFDKRANKIKNLAVDHNHITKQIRGLLYINCNQVLGKVKDSVEILQKAIEYLHKNN